MAAAIVALIASQFVMVLIMTMTPLHMTEHGHGLAAVGLVLSGHTLGMFALSPLSGRLTDRVRARPHDLPRHRGAGRLLADGRGRPARGWTSSCRSRCSCSGLGWNFGFVAGSAMLSEHLELHERTRVQGVADALIWSSAAAASLGSGLIMAGVGYTALGILGAGVVVIPLVVLRAHRRTIARLRETRVEVLPS